MGVVTESQPWHGYPAIRYLYCAVLERIARTLHYSSKVKEYPRCLLDPPYSWVLPDKILGIGKGRVEPHIALRSDTARYSSKL